MAFSYTVDYSTILGNMRVKFGTYTNGTNADSGGAIVTGLSKIWFVKTSCTSHVGATMPKHVISGGTDTIVTENKTSGQWIALGL